MRMSLVEMYYKEFPREILDILTGYSESEPLVRNFPGKFIVRKSCEDFLGGNFLQGISYRKFLGDIGYHVRMT